MATNSSSRIPYSHGLRAQSKRTTSRMIERVQDRGGTQLKFGGDALLSLFTGLDHATQAACAAVEMRQELRNAVRGATSLGRLALRMSAGVESGAIHLFLVGDAHHELVIAGPVATATTELEAGLRELVEWWRPLREEIAGGRQKEVLA